VLSALAVACEGLLGESALLLFCFLKSAARFLSFSSFSRLRRACASRSCLAFSSFSASRRSIASFSLCRASAVSSSICCRISSDSMAWAASRLFRSVIRRRRCSSSWRKSFNAGPRLAALLFGRSTGGTRESRSHSPVTAAWTWWTRSMSCFRTMSRLAGSWS
jgi:hypothetical protein